MSASRRLRTAAQDWRRRHRGLWVSSAAAFAWAALVVWLAADPAGHEHQYEVMRATSQHMTHMTDPRRQTLTWTMMWLLMVVAMMWPLYATPVHAVARATFRRWRIAAVCSYLAVITALWLALGLAGREIESTAAQVIPRWTWPLAWLLIATSSADALWRRRVLAACSRRMGTVAAQGWRSVASAARAGLRAWVRCAALCGPIMLAMVGTHLLAVMVGGSLAVWWEQRHPRAWHDPVPRSILCATAASCVLLSL